MQPAPSDASVSWDRDSLLVDLALQGGGAHGAYTWGVLDRLLEQPWLQVDGIFRHLGRRHERRRTGLWTFPGWERRCPHRVGDRLATRIRGGSVQCCASLYLHRKAVDQSGISAVVTGVSMCPKLSTDPS